MILIKTILIRSIGILDNVIWSAMFYLINFSPLIFSFYLIYEPSEGSLILLLQIWVDPLGKLWTILWRNSISTPFESLLSIARSSFHWSLSNYCILNYFNWMKLLDRIDLWLSNSILASTLIFIGYYWFDHPQSLLNHLSHSLILIDEVRMIGLA